MNAGAVCESVSMPFVPFTKPSRRLAALFALPIVFALAYQQYTTYNMSPTLAAIRRTNAELVGNLKGTPVAVIVGGTSGIGQGMAEAFARWREGRAHIVIVGRSEAAAKEIIDSFFKPSSGEGESWSHEFVKCDATLMKNVKTASEEILARHSKINYLIMSPGFFTTSGRDETTEGIDKKLAVHYYARWKFIDQLLPALRSAKEAEEESRVLSVLSAGMASGKVDVNDLGLKKGYSLQAAAFTAPTYNDLMIQVSPSPLSSFVSFLIVLFAVLPRTKPRHRIRPLLSWRCRHQHHVGLSDLVDSRCCSSWQPTHEAVRSHSTRVRRVYVAWSS